MHVRWGGGVHMKYQLHKITEITAQITTQREDNDSSYVVSAIPALIATTIATTVTPEEIFVIADKLNNTYIRTLTTIVHFIIFIIVIICIYLPN